ncbi:MAG: hypothetical protein Q8R57_10900, partial [Bacteroidota bacterium]|nr:hypothetical protein [Bacteroidota bacterium]
DLILLAKVNFILNQNADAFKATVKAIKLGISKEGLSESFSDSIGLVFQESSEYKKAIANFEKYHLEFKEKLNTERLLEIQQMLSIDIYARSLKTSDFCVQSFAYTVVRNADSLNEIALRKNIETYGFPNLKEIGLMQMNRIMVIIMHITAYRDKEDLYKFYDSTLNAQVSLGNFLPGQYAIFVDRHRTLVLGMPQKYGAFTTRSAYPDNIEDVKNVDFERSKIGLMPIFIESKLYTKKSLPHEYMYSTLLN